LTRDLRNFNARFEKNGFLGRFEAILNGLLRVFHAPTWGGAPFTAVRLRP
jgi:hypothetical protein